MPHSKWYVVACPRGSSDARSVAPFAVTALADTELTRGASGTAAVRNVTSPPRLVPAAFVATMRTW